MKNIFRQYPDFFTKSLGSFKLKMLYLKKRFKMDFKNDKDFPGILMSSYNETIRPRGEAMIKVKLL